MAERQSINLGSEEDLTSVRERLKRVNARHITLIVPPQTLLRSQTSWRVLREVAHRLNKDILVISPDHQFRAMVKDVGFRVDAPQASTASGRSRPSNFGRTPSRMLGTPQKKDARGSGRDQGSTESTFSTRHSQYSHSQPAKTPPDAAHALHIDDLGTGGPTAPLPSTYETSRDYYWPDYHNSISPPTSGSLRPVTPEPEYVDEKEEMFSSDLKQAQIIREAANYRPDKQDTMVSPELSGMQLPDTPFLPHSFSGNNVPYSNNSLLDADTALPPPPAEQPDNVSSVADYVIGNRFAKEAGKHNDQQVAGELIDDGDQGNIIYDSPPQLTVEDTPDESVAAEDDDTLETSNSSGDWDHTPRRGYRDRERHRQPSKGNDGSNQSIINQATRNLPERPRKQSRSAKFPSEAENSRQSFGTPARRQVSPGAARAARTASSAPSRSPKSRHPTPVIHTTGPLTRPSRVPRSRQRHVWNKVLKIAAIVLLCLVIVVLVMGYIVPSANVTVTLSSTTSNSMAIAFTATATSPLDVARHTLPAELLTYDTSVQGKGQATGNTTVGTVPARGTETFTNNSTQPVHVPTGTVIATGNSVQFVTAADALVLTGSNNTSIIPIQAQVSGTNGNVGAHSITVIPSSSMNTLQQVNNGQQIKLSITNASATSGGGTGTATAVSKNDLSKEQAALAVSLQNRINDFLKRQVHTGDLMGKPNLNETPVATPPVGTIVNNGSFTMQLNLHMTVLVVRANEIQKAAAQAINEMLKQQKAGYALVPEQALQITNVKNVPASNGNSLKLSFSAQGQIAPQIAVNKIRAAISRKTINGARTALLSGQHGFSQIKQVTISISPSFFPWVPFMQQRIAIHFLAVPSSSAPGPNKTKTK